MIKRWSNACVIAILVWMALPEVWTKPVVFDSVPLHFLLAQLLCLSLGAEGLMKRGPHSKFFWLLVAVIGYTAARAAFALDRNNWDLKYFVSDLWTVQMFVLAFLWSRRRSFQEIAGTCRLIAAFIVPLAVLTMVGLYLDIIRPVDQEYTDRLYTSSLWHIGCIAQFIWPILFVGKKRDSRRSIARKRFRDAYFEGCAGLLVPVALFIAVFTATRSLLIVSIVLYAAVQLTEPKRDTQQTVVTIAVLISVLGVGLTLASVLRVKGYSVLDRFQEADITQEGRGIELKWMFDQLGEDYISGWGFGGLFYSTIRYHNRPFETAPHIGIVTFLLKGGVIMALTFVLAPLIMCIRALSVRTPQTRAATGCVFVYFAIACLSGGWYPYQMLMFGMGVGILSARRGASRLQPSMIDLVCDNRRLVKMTGGITT